MKITCAESCGITSTIITTPGRISPWRGTRRLHERSKRRRRARSSQFLKSAACIIVTNEPHNVGDPVSSRVISIKSMGELSARAEINVHCCRTTCRRPKFESSIRRRDRHLIIREWVLHSQDGIFVTDNGDDGEGVLSPQHSHPIPQILNERLERSGSTHLVIHLP